MEWSLATALIAAHRGGSTPTPRATQCTAFALPERFTDAATRDLALAASSSPFEALNRLRELTADLDERGLVLALAAFAEDALGDLLSAFMQPGEASSALLVGFNAPLGTFSARIKAASALGLIISRQQENLDRLRKIRNAFAHSWEPVSFADQSVAAHITALYFVPLVDEYPRDAREKMRAVISALLTEIRATTHTIVEKGLAARTIGNHLLPGLAFGTPDEVGVCDRSLADIAQALREAKGERRDFLVTQQARWLGLLAVLRKGASPEDLTRIAETIARHSPLPE